MATGDADERHRRAGREAAGDLQRGDGGPAGRAVPALLERVGDPHAVHDGVAPRPNLARMPDLATGHRVLVTGGSGFLGRHVVARLRDRGADVVAPRSAEFDLTVPGAAEDMLADAPSRDDRPPRRPRRRHRLQPGPAGAAVPRQPADGDARHRGGPRTAGVETTVLVGTVCSYPKFTPVPFREESLWDGYPEETNAPYGLAKKAHLVHAQVNAAQYGQRFAYLIPTNLFGPGDKFHPSVSHVIPALIKKCVEATERGDDKVDVWGTGRASREYLYVDDAAAAITLTTAADVAAGRDPRADQPRDRPRGHDPRDRRDDRPPRSGSAASCGGIRRSRTASPGAASTPGAPSTCSDGGPRCRSRTACGRRSTGTSPTATEAERLP